MLGNAKVISFAATQNAAAATQFYEQTLGLTLVADEPFAVVFEANGTSLRLQKVQEFQPQPFTVLGPLALRIDHIGSTSVPGLGAKDVIDVQVTVAALTEVVRPVS